MPTTQLYLVRVIDSARQSVVMSGITVAGDAREAARRICRARFGKWTGADRVETATVSGLIERFDFADVAPSEQD